MSDKPVYLEEWEWSPGGYPDDVFRKGVVETKGYFDSRRIKIADVWDGGESADSKDAARLIAAAPALVRAVLMVEWAGVEGRDHDQCCPVCKSWVCTGERHFERCSLDAALTAAGFPDQSSRDAARARIPESGC